MINSKKINFTVVRNVGIGVIAILAFSSFSYWLTRSVLGVDRLREIIDDAGVWGMVFIVILKISTLVFAPLGGTPIYVVSALLYDFWLAFTLTFLGDLLGCTISFWIARKFGKKAITKFAGPNSMEFVEKLYTKTGGDAGILMACVFGFSDLVNYVAGLTPISFLKYMAIFSLFKAPSNVLFLSLAFFPEQSPSIKLLYVVIFVLYTLGAGIWWYKFGKRKAITGFPAN